MTPPGSGSRLTRKRHKTVIALIAIASVVGFLSVFALWAKRQLLETNTWTETSTKLLENEDVRTLVAGYMVDTLYANVDVQAEIQNALPPRAAAAAGPISGAVRNLADDLANKALERPRVQKLWGQANEATHHTLLDVIEHGGSEDVKLDLGTIVTQLGDQVGVSNAGSKLPADAAQIVILDNQKLVAAQNAVDLLQTLAWVLTAVTLLLYALAVYLAVGWRRLALRNVGLAFIAVGIAVLAGRGIAGNYVTGDLSSTAAVEPAVSAAWSIGTSVLAEIGGAMIFYGIVIVLGAWIAGPGPAGRAARRELAPVLANRGTAYGALAVLLLLLFWWAPTPGFQRLLPALLIIALFIAGIEALRRQALRDFPDATWESGMERWRGAGRSLFGRG